MSELQQFEAFMSAYQDMVFGTAMRLLSSEAEAEDISQEVFLKAYERYGELQQNPATPGWLRTVTRNLCLNHLSRYRARWHFFSEMRKDDEDRDFAGDLPAPDHWEAHVDSTDRQHRLEQALRRLPDAQRVPLVLYHFEELSYEEIAARLKISLSKVKTDMHRGRESLRAYFVRLEASETCGQGGPNG